MIIKRHFFMLFCLSFVFTVPGYSQTDVKFNIAVNDLKGAGVDDGTKFMVSERLRSELVKTSAYRVMERTEMESILKEQGFQQTGACEESSCLVKMAQFLGVERIVAGSIAASGKLWTLSLRMLDVGTGEILFTVDEDFEGDLKEFLSDLLPKAVAKLVDKNSMMMYAKLKVLSTPSGVGLFLNEKMVGKTPYENASLQPGNYSLRLSHPTYKDASDSISVLKGQLIEKQYTLTHTKAFLDSIAITEKAAHLKWRWVRRIGFGSLAVGSGVAGLLCNSLSEKRYDKYMANTSFDDPQHAADWESITNTQKTRNVLYILACVFGAATVASIPF
jgi:hypothetical protein